MNQFEHKGFIVVFVYVYRSPKMVHLVILWAPKLKLTLFVTSKMRGNLLGCYNLQLEFVQWTKFAQSYACQVPHLSSTPFVMLVKFS